MDDRTAALAKTTDRFRDVHEGVERAIFARHPSAARDFAHGMVGWRVKVQDAPPDWKGTYDPTMLQIFLVERKAGITLHVWDPRRPDGLDEHRAALTDAGFKVMVGCVQWNRKAEYPLAEVAAVIAAT